jgi:aldehyde dehydrogenase (NAD+)
MAQEQSTWEYAPSPEGTGHIKLNKKYNLFIDGKWVAPS